MEKSKPEAVSFSGAPDLLLGGAQLLWKHRRAVVLQLSLDALAVEHTGGWVLWDPSETPHATHKETNSAKFFLLSQDSETREPPCHHSEATTGDMMHQSLASSRKQVMFVCLLREIPPLP